jgi:hypothetical protein
VTAGLSASLKRINSDETISAAASANGDERIVVCSFQEVGSSLSFLDKKVWAIVDASTEMPLLSESSAAALPLTLPS